MSDFKKTNLANPEDNGYPDLDLECSSSAVQTMATNANQDGIQKNDKPTKRLYPMATFAMGAVVATLVTLVVVFLLQQDKSDSIQTSVSSALTVAPSSDQTFLSTNSSAGSESNQAQLIEAANQTEEENQDKEPPIEIPIQDLEEISPSSFRIRFHGSKEEHTDPPVSQETRIAPPRCDGPHYHDSYIVTDHTARWRVEAPNRPCEYCWDEEDTCRNSNSKYSAGRFLEDYLKKEYGGKWTCYHPYEIHAYDVQGLDDCVNLSCHDEPFWGGSSCQADCLAECDYSIACIRDIKSCTCDDDAFC